MTSTHPTITVGFLAYLKQVEGQNGLQSDGTYHVGESLEGGAGTIGYGHKLQAWEYDLHHITQEEAEALLQRDAHNAYRDARYRIDEKFGRGTWDDLDRPRKQALTDFSFNLGGSFCKKFPKFCAAVVAGDMVTAERECHRFYLDAQKVIHELVHRNDLFIEAFLHAPPEFGRPLGDNACGI